MRELLRRYRRSLPAERRRLLEGYRYRHMARQGRRRRAASARARWIVLLTGRDVDDPLFLQVKEAGPSALERHLGRRRSRNHGQRVVEGQRLMQVDGDIFLGWLRAAGRDGDAARDYYVRQLWDWKTRRGGRADVARAARPSTAACAAGRSRAPTPARATASRSPPTSAAATRSTARSRTFAERYADQNERDHAALEAAVRDGLVAAERGV